MRAERGRRGARGGGGRSGQGACQHTAARPRRTSGIPSTAFDSTVQAAAVVLVPSILSPDSGTQRARQAVVAPRRSRRQQQRAVVSLLSPLLPQADRREWEGLSRAERRQRVRALLRPSASAREAMLRHGQGAVGKQLAQEWLAQQMEAEADALCGAPKGKHCGSRTGRRHGYELGSVGYDGQRLPVERPRVRSLASKTEYVLSTYQQAQDESFLSAAMIGSVLAGAAERRYHRQRRPHRPPGGSASGLGVAQHGQPALSGADERAAG